MYELCVVRRRIAEVHFNMGRQINLVFDVPQHQPERCEGLQPKMHTQIHLNTYYSSTTFHHAKDSRDSTTAAVLTPGPIEEGTGQ
jgi:hypothetical protein